jgi:hypothetical protein
MVRLDWSARTTLMDSGQESRCPANRSCITFARLCTVRVNRMSFSLGVAGARASTDSGAWERQIEAIVDGKRIRRLQATEE